MITDQGVDAWDKSNDANEQGAGVAHRLRCVETVVEGVSREGADGEEVSVAAIDEGPGKGGAEGCLRKGAEGATVIVAPLLGAVLIEPSQGVAMGVGKCVYRAADGQRVWAAGCRMAAAVPEGGVQGPLGNFAEIGGHEPRHPLERPGPNLPRVDVVGESKVRRFQA